MKFNEIYDSYKYLFRKAARDGYDERVLGHVGWSVEDLEQEVLLAVYRKLDGQEPKAPGYVKALAYNTCADVVRRARSKKRCLLNIPSADSLPISRLHRVEESDARMTVRRVLCAVSPETSEHLLALMQTDCCVSEASRLCGTSRFKIKKSLKEARLAVRGGDDV